MGRSNTRRVADVRDPILSAPGTDRSPPGPFGNRDFSKKYLRHPGGQTCDAELISADKDNRSISPKFLSCPAGLLTRPSKLMLILVTRQLRLSEHLRLGALQHALESPQDRERQNDASILRLLEIAAKKIGERPNVGGCLREIGGHETSCSKGLSLREPGWRASDVA